MTQRSDHEGPAAARRERKRTRMKVMLQTEALRLFAEKGYEQTTVEDIADAAAISPRTFFRYFPAKEDVVVWDEGEAAAVRLWQSRAVNESLGASLWPLVRENLETLSRSDP